MDDKFHKNVDNKNKIRKIIVGIIIILILFGLLSFINKNPYVYDDYMIFKAFANSKSTTEGIHSASNIVQYKFDVEYKNMNFKQINLIDTIDSNSLQNGKIAPGISGKFQIIISSNIDSFYKIKIQDKNEKPQNLKFNLEKTNKDYNNLSDLQEDLTGKIKNQKEENITVKWYWPYDLQDNNEDIKDTYDGMNLENYNFSVCVLGQEV